MKKLKHNEQILKKAIEKAVKGGYNLPLLENEVLTFNPGGRKYGKNNSITFWRNGWMMSHDFAKAFWGDKTIRVYHKNSKTNYPPGKRRYNNWPRWQHHLRKMVIKKNPIKYLEGFL